MSWNYRVMAWPIEKGSWDEVWLFINEVTYDEKGAPNGFGKVYEAPEFREGEVAGGFSVEEVRRELHKMLAACDKPILCGSDRFPQEYKSMKDESA